MPKVTAATQQRQQSIRDSLAQTESRDRLKFAGPRKGGHPEVKKKVYYFVCCEKNKKFAIAAGWISQPPNFRDQTCTKGKWIGPGDCTRWNDVDSSISGCISEQVISSHEDKYLKRTPTGRLKRAPLSAAAQ